MLVTPPCGASSNIALWRAKIKPPVELVVGDLDNEKIQKEPIQGLCKTDIGSSWLSLPSPLPLGDG